MKIKSMNYFLIITLLCVLCLNGCGEKPNNKGSVFYLNFKPEVNDIWAKIAETYTAETGVEVKVLTAASGTYYKTLRAEIAKQEAPTLFQLDSPLSYEEWKYFCEDLSDTNLYAWLLDQSMAISTDEGVFGIPYVVEGYGIIYNDAIMQKYFNLPEKAVNISSTKEINNYETLKAVVKDMTVHKNELGIKGVFASTSFASGEEWRWNTHLLNLPIYYEFLDNNIVDTNNIQFSYHSNFKNILDLYTTYSITDKTSLIKKTVNDSMLEFAKGEVAMVQNGNWAWSQIANIPENTVTEENIKMLPIYTGVTGEENQGLTIGTESYFSVNAAASEEDKKATIDFLEWLFSSDIGKDFVSNHLGFISPFNTFSEDETPQDPLAQEVLASMSDTSKTSVSWNFTAFPSSIFKDSFGASLLDYLEGKSTWDTVVTQMKIDWAKAKGGQ